MFDLFLEALDVPRPGWPGRRRYIAGQLWRMAVEGVTFTLIVVALLGCVLLTAAAMDVLPVPRV